MRRMKRLFSNLRLVDARVICTYGNNQQTIYTLVLCYKHRRTGEVYHASQIVQDFAHGKKVLETYQTILK